MKNILSDFAWTMFSNGCPWQTVTDMGYQCSALGTQIDKTCAKVNCAPAYWAERFDEIVDS